MSENLDYKIRITREGSGGTEAVRELGAVETKASAVTSALKSYGAGLAAFFTASAVVGFAKDAVREFAEAEAGVNKLNNTLKASGRYTDAFSQELQRLANGLSAVTTQADDDILAVERMLLSFGAARSQMPQLTEAVLDLSTGLGTDLQSAAMQVGKAIQGEAQSFSRLGFQIDSTASATTQLSSVLDQIRTKFGGLARGEVNTLEGQTKQLSNAWKELKESIGSVLALPMAAGLRQLNGTIKALTPGNGGNAQESERDFQLARLKELQDSGQISGKAALEQRELIQKAFDARTQQTVQTFNGSGGFSNVQIAAADEAARAAALKNLSGLLADRNPPATEAGGPPQTKFDWGNAESISGHAKEVAEQRRVIAQQTTRDLTLFERQLTIDSLNLGGQRMDVINREFEARRAFYLQLAEQGKLSEQELTDALVDASDQRELEVAQEAARRRNAQVKAKTEASEFYVDLQRLGNDAMNTFAQGFSQTIVNAFRTGKFEARQFFSDLFAQIAQLIIQLLIVKAIKGLTGLFGDGGISMAASGGMFPTMAANGVAGVSEVSQATYFPRHNVIAGEAGREMLTVLARPQNMSVGGLSAVVGNAGPNRLAIVNAGQLGARLAANGGTFGDSGSGSSSGGGATEVVVRLSPGLEADIIQRSVQGARVQVTQDMTRDTALRSATKSLATA